MFACVGRLALRTQLQFGWTATRVGMAFSSGKMGAQNRGTKNTTSKSSTMEQKQAGSAKRSKHIMTSGEQTSKSNKHTQLGDNVDKDQPRTSNLDDLLALKAKLDQLESKPLSADLGNKKDESVNETTEETHTDYTEKHPEDPEFDREREMRVSMEDGTHADLPPLSQQFKPGEVSSCSE